MQKSSEYQMHKGQRILLINPPYYRLFKNTYSNNKYPLSLGYLAGAIKEKTRWNVTVYNADFVLPSESWQISYFSGEGFSRFRDSLQNPMHPIWKEIRVVLMEVKPAVVGIYCCVATSKAAAIIASIAKALDKQTIVILGGPHPTLIGKNALCDSNIDIIVKGEGEQTIVELLKTFDDNGQLEEVNGLFFRAHVEIVKTADRELITNLDALSFPSKWAKDVLKDYEKHPRSAFTSIIATRGCPYNCLFCESKAVFGRKTRFRSPDNVVAEITHLQRLGLNIFEFIDDTFGVTKEYLHELCNALIKDCPRIKWKCSTRVDLLDEDSVKLMKKAGCYQIAIGLESGNNEILHQIRKGITIEEIIAAAQLIKRHGIAVRTNILLGLPMETEQSLNETIDAMKKIGGQFCYSTFTPYPGSEAFEYCKNAGLIDNNVDVFLYNHQNPENFFCANISKKRFRALASEIEKYVDRTDAKEELKQLLSHGAIDTLLNFGAFRNLASLQNFVRSAIFELKLLLRNLVSK